MQALGLIETRGLIAAVESADAMLKAADVTLLEKTYVGGGLVTIAVTGAVSAVKAAVEAGAAAVNHIDAALLISEHVIPRPHEEVNGLIGSIKPLENVELENVGAVITENKEEASDAEILAGILAVVDSKEDKKSEGTVAEVRIAEDKNSKATQSVVAIAEDKNSESTMAEEAIGENRNYKSTKAEEAIVEDKNYKSTKAEEAIVEDKNYKSTIVEDTISENTVEDIGIEKYQEKVISLDINTEDTNKESVDKLVLEAGFQKALEVLNKLKVTKLRNLAREYENLRITGRRISKANKKLLLSVFEEYYNKKE